MQTFLIVLIVGVAALVCGFVLTLRLAHALTRHHAPVRAPLPDGHVRERAARLERESARYQSYLSDRLIQRSTDREGGKRDAN